MTKERNKKRKSPFVIWREKMGYFQIQKNFETIKVWTTKKEQGSFTNEQLQSKFKEENLKP